MGVLDAPPAVPVARDQLKLTDVLLRAVQSQALNTQTGNSIILTWGMAGFASFCIQVTGDSNQFQVQGSNDLDQWAPLDVRALGVVDAPISQGWFQDNNAPTLIGGNKTTKFVRLVIYAAAAVPAGVLVCLSQQMLAPMRPARTFGADNLWAYSAPVGGIVNNTPVTLAPSTNPYHRNSMASLQVSNVGGTTTEVIITDTAGPTVLWRDNLGTGASRTVKFDPLLRGAASSSITLTLSAATGAQVYANAQGIVGLA
jgi:hypothetical protein